MQKKSRILIIEDEKKIARFLQLELEHEGYICTVENSGHSALDRIVQENYDLILLDLMLPDIDGLTICGRTREINDVPILILSAKDDIDTKVHGLDLGANDYMTKPFSSRELLARVRALLRKAETLKESASNTLSVHDITIQLDQYEVKVGNRPIHLTKKEFDLLVFLVKNQNVVSSRESILEEVWGYDYIGDTNVVDVYIRYLRSKIDETIGRKYIFTVRGIGYVIKS